MGQKAWAEKMEFSTFNSKNTSILLFFCIIFSIFISLLCFVREFGYIYGILFKNNFDEESWFELWFIFFHEVLCANFLCQNSNNVECYFVFTLKTISINRFIGRDFLHHVEKKSDLLLQKIEIKIKKDFFNM